MPMPFAAALWPGVEYGGTFTPPQSPVARNARDEEARRGTERRTTARKRARLVAVIVLAVEVE